MKSWWSKTHSKIPLTNIVSYIHCIYNWKHNHLLSIFFTWCICHEYWRRCKPILKPFPILAGTSKVSCVISAYFFQMFRFIEASCKILTLWIFTAYHILFLALDHLKWCLCSRSCWAAAGSGLAFIIAFVFTLSDTGCPASLAFVLPHEHRILYTPGKCVLDKDF